MPLPQQLIAVATRVPVIGRVAGGRQHGTPGRRMHPEESVSSPDRLPPSSANVPVHSRLQSPNSPPKPAVSNVSVKAPVALLTVPLATVPAPERHAVSVVPVWTRLMDAIPETDAPVIDHCPVTSSADAAESRDTPVATSTAR